MTVEKTVEMILSRRNKNIHDIGEIYVENIQTHSWIERK